MDLMYRDDLIGYYTPTSIEIVNQTPECIRYFGDTKLVEGSRLHSFIRDRIISCSRKDINEVLKSLNLTVMRQYNIALATRLLNPNDSFWLRGSELETYQNFAVPKLMELFSCNYLTAENTLPASGQNIKYYAKYQDKFGLA